MKTTIDPTNCFYYEADDELLQRFMLFCILVAGKKASEVSKLVDRIIPTYTEKPFDLLKALDTFGLLELYLREHRVGQYARVTSAIKGVLALESLRTVTRDELVKIKGIGLKTASFFLQYTQRGHRFAVLDTHILKHMKSLGYDVPKSTPNNKQYLRLESEWLSLLDKSGLDYSEADLNVWKMYAGFPYEESLIPYV